MQPPSPDDQPTIRTGPPNGSRPAPLGWQAPSVEEMQALLPQYEIMEILGRGGMGAVYKGRQKSLKRLVAIKILPLGMADDEMKFVERFQNEAQTMAAMNHPAIVSVYDFGETPDGLLYFIMEFVDGTDVQKMIQASGKLSGDYALAITAHVCDALSYAHKRGVIHRDIKPANILIDQEGHIKVADFGLAKMSDPSQTSGLTKTNMAMGTPDYVAPEVLVTGMVADHRADIYAVGVMLYQMLTGEVPRGMFKLPSQKGLGTDVRFDDIICKAMEQDREERYQSAMDVRHALDVILTTPQPKDDGTGIVPVREIPQKPVAKGPRPPGERSQPPAQKPAPQQAPAQKAAAAPKAKAAPKKQSPAAMWLSIGGIVAVLGIAGFLVLSGKPKHQVSNTTDNTSATEPSAKPQPPIKVRENPKPTASSTSAKGKEIDLLALVDLKRDVLLGEWERTADGLAKKGSGNISGDSPRVQFRHQPPEEYDIEFEFTPAKGTQSLGLVLSAESRAFSWMLGGGTGLSAGFESFDTKPTSIPSEVSATLDQPLAAGRHYRSRVEVRAGGLRGFLDDKLLVDWDGSGKFKRLGRAANTPDELYVNIRAARDVTFHKVVLREISGTAKVDAGIATKSSSATAKTIDLLPLVDVKRDMIGGDWSREGGDLLVKGAKPDANGTPRLQLPYQPPEEYDFEIEFTPESGTNMAGQVLSAYQHSFSWQLDSKLATGSKVGFDALDGLSVARRADGTAMRPTLFLTNGQRHRSTVEVRRTGVRGLLDGQLLVTWGSAPSSYDHFEISKNEKLRDALHLGLIAYDRAVRFHKITVREITGAGKVETGTALERSGIGVGFIQTVARANGPQQVNIVRAKLKELNRVEVEIEPTVVTGKVRGVVLKNSGADVTDISALAAFRDLQTLDVKSIRPLDMSCLVGLPLVELICGDDFKPDPSLLRSFPTLKTINGRPAAEFMAGSGGPGSSTAPPNITNWQDVTGMVKEQAKAKPGFSFDGDLIGWTGDKQSPPRLDVTPAGRNDYAIRLKHVGAGQINVRANEKGFVYVQTAPSGLRINRWMKGVVAPVTLFVAKDIPFSYDKGEPHDLTVTVQGSTIRAWLDGQLMGTVEDTTFAEGTGAVALVSYGKVQKVEVAELTKIQNAASALSR